MRVMHWDVSFLHRGAVSRSVLGLARSQAGLGAEVVIAAAQPSGAPLYAPTETDGVSVLEWQPRWSLRFDGFLLRGIPSRACGRLRAFRPDLVHIHGGFNPDNLWVPRLFHCPVVFSPHGAYHPEVFLKSRRIPKAIYLRIEKQFLHRRVTAVHALSPIERTLVKRFVVGPKTYCLPQGPGIQTLAPASHESPVAPAGIASFVFVGRLDVFTKGLDILFAAFAKAKKQLDGQATRLTLVGPDWRHGLAWLQRRGGELGIADEVRFTGPLAGPEVLFTLTQSHIYVQLSRHDAFPLSVVEAMLMGKPAILSEAVGPASYPEIAALPHVRIVRLNVMEAAEAMVDFACRLDEVTILAGQRRREVCDFFSWDRIARAQLTMYEKILSGVAGLS